MALLVTGGLAGTPRLTVVAVLLTLVALGWMLATRALRSRYLARFQSQLGAGQLDSLASGPLDLRSAEILAGALGSPRPVEVLTALELLARSGRPRLIPALVLHHPETSVVLAALRVLAPLRRSDVEAALPSLLRHASPEVRSAVVRCWLATGRSDAELLPLLEDPESGVRAAALVALSADPERGRPFRTWLFLVARRGELDERRALARAIAEAPRQDLLRLALWMFHRGDREIRQELLRAADGLPALPPRFVSRSVALLTDPVLRPGARRGLVAMGRPAQELLELLLLREATPFALAREIPAVLAEFPPEDAAPALLRRVAQPRGGLDRFRALRALNHLRRKHPRLPLDALALANALEIELAGARNNRALRQAGERLGIAGDGDPAGRLLLDLLEDKETRALERLFRTLDLLLPGRQLERAFRATQSSSAEQRETAREVLLELLPARWREAVLELLGGPALLHGGLVPRTPLTRDAFLEAIL
ncbi:MAG TPA: HEAT repeat domain-containing protein, partial [Myxococcaceae bacterium]